MFHCWVLMFCVAYFCILISVCLGYINFFNWLMFLDPRLNPKVQVAFISCNSGLVKHSSQNLLNVMKINLLVLANNFSSWKMYWREDPPILKMNRKQLQLWLFVGARLKENYFRGIFQLLPCQTALGMIAILKEYSVSYCLCWSPRGLDSNSLFDLFSYSTAPLSHLPCIISVKRSF